MIEIPRERRSRYLRTCRVLAAVSAVLALLYLKWLLFDARPEYVPLYWLLVVAEVFNVLQAGGFWLTISIQKWNEPPQPDFAHTVLPVDIFVTVMDEPLDIVDTTLRAAAQVRHPRAHVHVLDDGHNEAVRALAERIGVDYMTRPDHTGAKAGSLNHALARTAGIYFAIFDADQAPHPDFLEATLGAFDDRRVAFVQTPQVYRNRGVSRVAAGAHDQQALFYGPIMRGKNGAGAAFSCGTNMVFRRSAVDEIGGIPQDSITEDLRCSLMLHQRGHRSVYVSRVLAEGLGPLSVGAYFDQQYRWGRGGLEILWRRRPFTRGLRAGQGLQYALGFMYWFTGLAYLSYLVLPASFLIAGLRPVQVPNDYPVHFLPYALMALATIVYASDFQIRFDALWFTLASFPVHARAIVASILSRRTARFVVTPKHEGRASLRPALPQILTIAVLAISAVYGLARLGPEPSVVNNVAWIVAHIVILQGFVRLAARPRFPHTHSKEARPR